MNAVNRYVFAFVAALVIASLVFMVNIGKQYLNSKVQFFVIGDWGRNGTFNQRELGIYMDAVAHTFQPQFIISTGDNFYPGGLGVNDEQFDLSFRDIYNGNNIQNTPWYIVLGNHDYGKLCSCTCSIVNDTVQLEETAELQCCNSPLWQIGETAKQRDHRWNCERNYEKFLAGGLVHVIFIDTSPFVDAYKNEKEYFSECQGGIIEQCWECQLKEIEQQLNSSTAPWKIVVGHHTMYSNGLHKNTTDLVQRLDPLLKQYKVQLYLNGHDHNLEHIQFVGQKIHYVTSGAGSATRSCNSTTGSWFQWDKSGFVAITITKKYTKIDYYGLDIGLLFTIQIQQDGGIESAKKLIKNRYNV